MPSATRSTAVRRNVDPAPVPLNLKLSDVVVFPNAKINLGLRILEKRSDGFHDLETIFYPIPLYDALEIIREPDGQPMRFTSTGLEIAGDIQSNLCVKAYDMLRQDFPELPPVHIHLQKAIPSGAGMGGGSADASFTLKLLNQVCGLKLPPGKLLDYSLRLGSDCPFFIINKPCYATGRGEILETIPVDLSAYGIVIVNPGIHVPTGPAFSWLTPGRTGTALKNLISLPVEQWHDQVINDFEEPVSQRHPEIRSIRNDLYAAGAVYASMSGSGSTVYGLFPSEKKPVLSFPSAYLLKTLGFK